MTEAVAEPTAPVSLGIEAELLLARLLVPTKRPPTLRAIRSGLDRFFRQQPTTGRWQETVEALRSAGLLTPRALRLTDAGRTRALELLGIRELPPRCKWQTIQARFLLPVALGLPPTARDARKRIEKAEGLAALLLKRHFDLPVGASPTLGQVLEALACKRLGFPGETSLAAVKAEVLSRLIDSDERLTPQDLKKKLPRVLLNAKRGGVTGIREVVLHGWADGATRRPEPPPPLPPEPAEFDLTDFAETVKAAARDCPTGRFGDNKVFISHVWRRLSDEPPFRSMDLPTFKQRLTEANPRLLTLSRADLVQAMNEADVRESETEYLGGRFHFILLDKEQP
jgi:hypothetical protein